MNHRQSRWFDNYQGAAQSDQILLNSQDIDFEDDRESSLFKASVRRTHRPAESTGGIAPEPAPETQNLHQKQGLSEATLRNIAPEIAPELFALLERIAANPRITTAELATVLNVSRRAILYRTTMLKEKGMLRIGSRKGGLWEFFVTEVGNFN